MPTMGVGAGGETLDTRALAPIEPPDWPIAAERCMRNAPVACYCLLLLSGGWQRASVTTDSELGGIRPLRPRPAPFSKFASDCDCEGPRKKGLATASDRPTMTSEARTFWLTVARRSGAVYEPSFGPCARVRRAACVGGVAVAIGRRAVRRGDWEGARPRASHVDAPRPKRRFERGPSAREPESISTLSGPEHAAPNVNVSSACVRRDRAGLGEPTGDGALLSRRRTEPEFPSRSKFSPRSRPSVMERIACVVRRRRRRPGCRIVLGYCRVRTSKAQKS